MSQARKRRGAARATITRLEESIQRLELKLELTRSDRLLIPHLAKKLEDWDPEFKKQHYAILDLLDEEGEETIAQEQKALDEYDDKITSFLLRLEELKREDEAVPPMGPTI